MTLDLLSAFPQIGEYVSLSLIIIGFILVVILASKIRTRRSFQFEILIVSLILVASELPRVGESLGFVQLSSYDTLGISVHAISMSFLSGFVLYRTYGFLKKSEDPKLRKLMEKEVF